MQLSLNNNRKLLQAIAIGVVALVIVILGFSLLSLKKDKPEHPEQKYTVDQLIPPIEQTQNLPAETKSKKEKLIAAQIENDKGDVVLVKTEGYRIIYVPTPDIFLVTIFKNPDQSKTQSQDFFIKAGFEQKDLCTLPVRFLLFDFELKKQNPDFNIMPDDC